MEPRGAPSRTKSLHTASTLACFPSMLTMHSVLHGTTSPSKTLPFKSSVSACSPCGGGVVALELCEWTRSRPMVPESPERSSVESVDSSSKRSRLTFGGSTNGSRDAGGAFDDLGLGLAPGDACDATGCDASSSSSSSSSSSCTGLSSPLQRSDASSGASSGSSSPASDGLSPDDEGALAVRLSADACSTTQSGSSLSDMGGRNASCGAPH
eukprot:scaffold112302_cov67-Phaeocystis_antarctica.AAC.11